MTNLLYNLTSRDLGAGSAMTSPLVMNSFGTGDKQLTKAEENDSVWEVRGRVQGPRGVRAATQRTPRAGVQWEGPACGRREP